MQRRSAGAARLRCGLRLPPAFCRLHSAACTLPPTADRLPLAPAHARRGALQERAQREAEAEKRRAEFEAKRSAILSGLFDSSVDDPQDSGEPAAPLHGRAGLAH